MHTFVFFAVFALVRLALPFPLTKRISTPVVDDGIILNYALTLEHLKTAFYQYGLAMYGQGDFLSAGFEDPFYDTLLQIYLDGLTHVTFWTGALWAAGIEPTVELQYSFPVADPESFVTMAGVFESLGVSAYLGLSPSLQDKDYLTACNSVLGVTGRHASYLRASIGESPFPYPFDTPLSFNAVHSLATLFINSTSLANNPVQLPFQRFPTLTLACSPFFYESGRSSVTFFNAFQNVLNLGIPASTPIFAAFFSGLQVLPVLVRTTSGSLDYIVDQIPAGISGQVYVFLSLSDENFDDENIVAGPAIMEVYPKGRIPDRVPRRQC